MRDITDVVSRPQRDGLLDVDGKADRTTSPLEDECKVHYHNGSGIRAEHCLIALAQIDQVGDVSMEMPTL